MINGDNTRNDFNLSRAKAAVLSRDFELAERLYRNILRNQPDDIEILHDLASMYIRSNQDTKALQIYERILGLDIHDFDALNNLGGIYRRLGKYNEALAVLDRALELEPNNIQVFYNLGFTYKQLEMFHDAIDCFNTVIDANPNDILSYNHLGSIHSLLNDSKNAIATYKRGLQMDPNHPVLHLNLAKEFEKLNRDIDAKQEYEAALRAKPGWSDALNAYALFLMGRNQNAEAYDLLQRGIKVSPDYISLQNSMGLLQLRRGDYSDASNRFKTVLTYNASDKQALFGLADAYSHEGNTVAAANILEKAKVVTNTSIEDQIQYDRSLLNAGKISESGSVIKKLWDENKNNIDVLHLLSEYYACSNNENKVHTCVDMINANSEDYKNHILDIALRFNQAGNYKQAENFFKDYLGFKPNDVRALTALASCYETLRQYREALNYYKKALQKDNENLVLSSAIERINSFLDDTENFSRVSLDSEVLSEEMESLKNEENSTKTDIFEDFDDKEEIALADDESIGAAEVACNEDSEENKEKEEKPIVFNFDGMKSLFSKREDVYDPLELEPIEAEPVMDDVGNLETLTFDGTPMDYEPEDNKPMISGESDDMEDLEELVFDDSDFISENTENEDSFALEEDKEEPYQTPMYQNFPQGQTQSIPQNSVQNEKISSSTDKDFDFETENNNSNQLEQTLEKEKNIEDTFNSFDKEQKKESFIPQSSYAPPKEVVSNSDIVKKEITKETLQKLNDLLKKLTDKKIEKDCNATANMFRHMKNLCSYLPPLERSAFFSGTDRVKLDSLINKLSGRPGLLATAEAIRQQGLVEVPEEVYDVVKKFDTPSVIGKVFGFMRPLIRELPDQDAAAALDNAVSDIIQRLSAFYKNK